VCAVHVTMVVHRSLKFPLTFSYPHLARSEAATDGWRRILDFFGTHLTD
jgi:hypothetical protein